MALPGYSTTVKASGAAVVITGEATTHGTGNVYQITAAARRILDPATAVVVKDGGTPVTGCTVDYLFGNVTLPAPPGGAVTVDAAYLPVLSIAEVRSFSAKGSRTMLDKTSFDSSGARQKLAGLMDGGGSLEAFTIGLEDLDSGTGGTQSLVGFMTNGTPKLIEAVFGACILRMWTLIEAIDEKATTDGLVMMSGTFVLAPQAAGASMAFGT